MKARVFGQRRKLAAAAALLASTLVGVSAAGPAQAAGSCTASYSVFQWQSVDYLGRPNYVYNTKGTLVWTGEPTLGHAYLAAISVNNAGDAVNPWMLAWESPGGTLPVGGSSSIANATLTGLQVTEDATSWQVTAPAWNPQLATGGRATVYVNARVMDPTITTTQLISSPTLVGRPCSM